MIVLVDDRQDARDSLIEGLRSLGHEVNAYASLRQLPRLSSLRGVTALVTRYELPDGIALAFTDLFSAIHPAVPVVVLTAASSPALAQQIGMRRSLCVRAGPINCEELHTLIAGQHHVTG